MTPYLGQAVVIYGGLDNSLSEHAAIVTFVHRAHRSTLEGQLGTVNVRIFLDSTPTDVVKKYIPVMPTRQQAIQLNLMGAGYIAYIPGQEDVPVAPQSNDDEGVPPVLGAMAAVELPQTWNVPGGVVLQ